ncbi:MAG TPA: carboxymuconolactone decarboxylase family protein [Spirochaetia bacterium]|nr:carboxymuconolactone decarboxylase family protein [Spirochaetia bacterium]
MISIDEPRRMPFLFRFLFWLVERRLGRRLVGNRLLAWYPRLLVGSGVMESLAAHDEPEVPRRLLTLIRMRTSFLVSCPFCIDMNSRDYDRRGISDREVRVLQGRIPLEEADSLSAPERAALGYVECICRTPLAFPGSVIEEVRRHFSERAMVIIAGTCAQVNFWARLLQALGAPPAGFSSSCDILDLDFFSTSR